MQETQNDEKIDVPELPDSAPFVVRLPRHLHERLHAYARKHALAKADVIRLACRYAIDRDFLA